jgi:hypothetical protein
MNDAQKGATIPHEALSRLAVREAREEALDRCEALLFRGELRARREREHGLELRGRELAAFALNRSEERGELRGREGRWHGRTSGEGREEKAKERREASRPPWRESLRGGRGERRA